MARLLRGEIRLADLGGARGREQQGHRPVLILSQDVFNERSSTVIAVVLATKPPSVGFPLVLALGPKTTPKPSWVKIGQIRTLSADRVHSRVGRASAVEISRVLDGLNEILGR